MIFFYSMAMLPILVGLVMWCRKRQVIWWEWIAGSIIALAMAGIFHGIALHAQCGDREIFSGKVVSATHHPYWQSRVRVEDYETETYTDGDGNVCTRRVHVGHHYEYHNHPEHWTCDADFGSYAGVSTHEIDEMFFHQIASNFCGGKLRTTTPHKSDFYKGDRNEYVADNKTKFIYPTTRWMRFQNRIKASPSLYSYAPVPKDAKVFPYPSCGNMFKSDRLLGTAKQTIPIRDFDVLCSSVGSAKKVNLIMIGFGNVDSEIAHLQEASWIGGKKNDLILCYGGLDPLNPSWAYVFGWTDREIVKANLQSILLGNPVDITILPLVEAEVRKNYEIKEWRDFNYLQVDPPGWSYWVYLICMGGVQLGFWMWASKNEFGKDGKSQNRFSYSCRPNSFRPSGYRSNACRPNGMPRFWFRGRWG